MKERLAIQDLVKMPKITKKKLKSLKKSELPYAYVYFCNNCGSADSVAIYCCSVKPEKETGDNLGNFTECVVWFDKGIIRRVV